MTGRRGARRPATIVLFLAVSAIGGAARAVAAETRRAVLVGIDKYVPADASAPPGTVVADAPNRGRPRGAWTNLEGAVNDVEELRAILVTRYGFRAADVHVITNQDATRDGILSQTRKWLIDGAAPGDVSLFFYAGHGSQVRNSRSQESDKLDESIVPSDANAGRPDVRDKELARLFDDALDKKILLTAVFDSCHSGSIGRGAPRPTRFRVLPADERDVADPQTPVPPETRGALVLSAAQDYQLAAETEDENKNPHGLFTWALLKVLRSMPVNESADRMFLRLRAVMQSGDTLQEPVLAATPERRRSALFGIERPDLAGRSVVAVQSVEDDGGVILQGGLAIGLRPGTELRRVDEGTPPLTLRVSEDQGLSRARATSLSGTTKDLKAGALFEVTRWTGSAGPSLRVWLGATTLTSVEVSRVAETLAPLASASGVSWIEDPTAADGPVSVIQHSGSSWQLASARSTRTISGDPSPGVIGPLLTADAGGARRVMLNLPLPSEAAARLDVGSNADAIEVLRSPAHADYVLVGRRRGATLEYAWVRPLVTAEDVRDSPLPARTDWAPLGDDPSALAARLHQFAVRLAVLRAWLTIESPPDSGRFPYDLALKRSDTGELRTTGETHAGEAYGLVLTLDQAKLGKGSFEQRYVYVFTIDSSGRSQLLFPPPNSGNVENHLPAAVDEQGRAPQQISLGPAQLFKIAPPFGIDTYVMLTSAIALADATVLEGGAVQTRGAVDPLTRLLGQASAGKRGSGITTPTDWSIERLSVRSVPAAR